jgi:hypothetical protein
MIRSFAHASRQRHPIGGSRGSIQTRVNKGLSLDHYGNKLHNYLYLLKVYLRLLHCVRGLGRLREEKTLSGRCFIICYL